MRSLLVLAKLLIFNRKLLYTHQGKEYLCYVNNLYIEGLHYFTINLFNNFPETCVGLEEYRVTVLKDENSLYHYTATKYNDYNAVITFTSLDNILEYIND
jgi:hypothetical protein